MTPARTACPRQGDAFWHPLAGGSLLSLSPLCRRGRLFLKKRPKLCKKGAGRTKRAPRPFFVWIYAHRTSFKTSTSMTQVATTSSDISTTLMVTRRLDGWAESLSGARCAALSADTTGL